MRQLKLVKPNNAFPAYLHFSYKGHGNVTKLVIHEIVFPI